MGKKVLGKGLEALIPKRAAALAPDKEFTYLPLDKLTPGKYQPRREVDGKELEELSLSIKEKGVIQPIVVREIDGGLYEVVAGGRRYAAAKLLGLNEIATIIKNLNDKDALIYAVVENLQRKDLNPVEEAEAFKRLMWEFEFTLDDIAKFVGKDKTTVANTLRLLRLPEEIKEALRKGVISRSQARTILSAEKIEEQNKLFQMILGGGMSVREAEEKVKRISIKKKKAADPFAAEMEEKLQKFLGTKVRIFNRKNNRGRMVIEYYNLKDLERIISRLGKGA